jgi:phosphoglycerate kinase
MRASVPALFTTLPLASQNVLLRLDLNVPLDASGHITSDARIQAALPTIQALIAAKARLAIASHLGRPQGKKEAKYSLLPVGERLSELLKQEVILTESCIGESVDGIMRQMQDGQVVLLENLRFHAGEENNDPEFAQTLAAPFKIYINDAFGAAHREHASIVGVIPHMRYVAMGYLFQQEISALNRLRMTPEHPFMAIIGGAKVSDKIGVLQALLKQVDVLAIGGAMAYSFLAASGYKVGNSRVESDKLSLCQRIIERARVEGVRIILPCDHIGAHTFSADAAPEIIHTVDIPPGLMGLDIGPNTSQKVLLSRPWYFGMVPWACLNGLPLPEGAWPLQKPWPIAVAQRSWVVAIL